MPLFGRHAEQQRLHDFVSARRLGAGVMSVSGPAGIGVSTLLADAADVAISSGFTTAATSGRRDETGTPGALATEILGSLGLDGVGNLGDRQADWNTVLLEQLAKLSAPTLVTVDDAHWADPESVAALCFAVRRLGATPIGVVLGVDDRADMSRLALDTVELGPLEQTAFAAMVRSHADLDAAVVEALWQATGGVPLVALEMLDRLDDAQRSGAAALPPVPLVAPPLLDRYRDGLRSLPTATQRALCVAAAHGDGDIHAVDLALQRLGETIEALEAAEEAGVVHVENRRIRFDHPLRRVAAYHLLAAPSRRATHRALAASLVAPREAAARAAHLAAGVLGTDDAVAADIERLAEHVAGRGDAKAARRWWRIAADLTADPDERRRRLQMAERSADDVLDRLTRAERRVAGAVGRGMANKEAAAHLVLSVKTVDAHLQSIYRKLEIRSRAELAILIARSELLVEEDA